MRLLGLFPENYINRPYEILAQLDTTLRDEEAVKDTGDLHLCNSTTRNDSIRRLNATIGQNVVQQFGKLLWFVGEHHYVQLLDIQISRCRRRSYNGTTTSPPCDRGVGHQTGRAAGLIRINLKFIDIPMITVIRGR